MNFFHSSTGAAVRRFLLLAVAMAAALIALPAYAADKTVAIIVEGTGVDSARGKISGLVPKGVGVADEDSFKKDLAKAGQKGQLGPAITSAKTRDKLVKAVRKAADSAKVDAVIVARGRKVKGSDEIYLLWIDASDVKIDQAVGANDDVALKTALNPELLKLAPPPPKQQEPTKNEVPPPNETPKDETPKDEAAPNENGWKSHNVPTELFEVRVAYELGGRWFSYSDPLPEAATLMRSYSVFGAGLLAVSGEIYPLASSGKKIIRDIGVTGELDHAFGLSSALKGGTPISSYYDRYRFGLRGRYRIGGDESTTLGLRGAYQKVAFGFNDSVPGLDGTIANVSYGNLDIGADVRFPLGRVGFTLAFDYLLPLSKGDGTVYTRFTDPSVSGIELRGGIGIGITSGLEARILIDYNRFFYAFKPVPGDKYVAGGALDQFLGLSGGLAYVY